MSSCSRTLNSSVYLGDLADNVTEQLIYDKFAQAGTIQSVRLCRDSSTRKPLGYAYVNFATPADATRALETLNHVELCGKQIRLMPSQRDPSSRRSGVGNVFAKNLDPVRVTNKVLHETFERYGRVLSAKVATDASGRSKGYGFVQFDDPQAAQQAIDGLHLSDLCGQQLFVGPFIPAKDRAAEPGKFCNIYVRNLGSDVDEETLRSIFSDIGPITSTVVMRNASGKSRGFGFVNYEDADHAARAVAEMDGFRHNGLKWKVNRAQKRNEEDEGHQRRSGLVRSNLYLRNLDTSCTDEGLRELFQDFGLVETARVLKDASGKSKGIGLVQFAEAEDAEAAITGMNGKTMGKSPKPLFVTLAHRKQPMQSSMSEELPPKPKGPFGLTSSNSISLGPPMAPNVMPASVAFFPASPSFFYGPVPVPVANSHMVHSPYFVSMGSGPLGSGPLPVNQQAVLDRRGSLVSLPSGPYGMGSSPSAPLPVPRPCGMVSINSGPLPTIPSESRASAPLPMYGGLMTEGHRRGRKMRGRQGAVYSPQVLAHPPAVPASHQAPPPPRARPVLTSPFSAVQAMPPLFMASPRETSRAASMAPRASTRSASSASSLAAPMLSTQMSCAVTEEGCLARRQTEQRRMLREYISKKSRRWADEATQILIDMLNPPQIATLLTDSNALAIKVDGLVAKLEANAKHAAPACGTEEPSVEGESEHSGSTCIPVTAT